MFWRQHQEKRLLLVVYVDDVIITSEDAPVITDFKCYLQKHFNTKDLESFPYFLGVEGVRSKKMNYSFSEKVYA